jgi:hypothetical protein
VTTGIAHSIIEKIWFSQHSKAGPRGLRKQYRPSADLNVTPILSALAQIVGRALR